MTTPSQSRAISLRPGQLLAANLDYFLVDASGSMSDKWPQTLAGIEAYMDVLRSENIASHGILHLFGSQPERIERDNTIGEWSRFHDEWVKCDMGLTALYDAINVMGRRLKQLDPPRARIVIVTDGDENNSQTSAAQASAILNWCRAKGWQVTFLGAEFDNRKQIRLLGANERNSLAVQKTKLIDAGRELGRRSANNARSGDDINFTEEERTTFGGYLTGPSK